MHFALITIASLAIAANPARVAVDSNDVGVPDALRPWIPWVLHGAERDRCPQRTDGTRVCEEPGRLDLGVEHGGGTFAQAWGVDVAGVVVLLPGDARHWPLDVEVDGKPAIVADLSG